MYVGDPGEPTIKQRLDEGMDKPEPFISGIKDKTVIGFKYYDCQGIRKVSVKVRGYGDGVFEVKTAIDGPALAEMKVENTNIWTEYSSDIALEDGVYAIYISYKGSGSLQMLSFALD
jgi:hypothetical protein